MAVQRCHAVLLGVDEQLLNLHANTGRRGRNGYMGIMTAKQNSLDEIAKALLAAQHIAITTHIRPDGDAVGSALGLCRLLCDVGKSATVVDFLPLPDRYRFLVSSAEIATSSDIDFSNIDTIVVLDSGALDRTPPFVKQQKGTINLINIDHHVSNSGFGDLNYVDTRASSVGDIICNLASAANLTIQRHTAEALWVAIVTDTGRFSYSNTVPESMEHAATLLRTGIDPAAINRAVYNTIPLRQLRLQERAIQNLSVHEDGQLAITAISRSDFRELQCTPIDADEIVNLPRSLAGVKVAVFVYELLDSEDTKISLRTTEPFDAAEFCRTLGGGGHAGAAGCSIAANLDQAKAEVLKRLHTHWFSV